MEKIIIIFGLFLLLLSCKNDETELFSITYNGNGNTSGFVPIDINSYKLNTEARIMKGVIAKDGYLFKHWNTKVDDTGISFSNEVPAHGRNWNDTTIISENINLYAIWEKIPIDSSIEITNISNLNHFKEENKIVIQWDNPSNISTLNIVAYYYHTDEIYYTIYHGGIGYGNTSQQLQLNNVKIVLNEPIFTIPPVKKLIIQFRLGLSNNPFLIWTGGIQIDNLYTINLD